MLTDEIQRTDLRRYLPHVVMTTVFLVALPLFAAFRLGRPPFELSLLPTTILCTLLSVTLGRLGAKMWEKHPGSNDVVFDDLLLWGFVRRFVSQKRVLTNANLLAGGLSRKDRLAALTKLAKSLENGDPYTHGHSDRVARHAYMIARAMRLPRQQREKVRLAAALHDVGKLVTPREILTKPGHLTEAEYEIVKRHPADGADMLAALEDDELTAMVRHHHERLDGRGYPHRLSGDEIPLGARIISVADTFDAITSRRAYRSPKRHQVAMQILVSESGTQLDAKVVKAFISYYRGGRGIRTWLSLGSVLPRLIELGAGAARQIATNGALAGGTAVALVGSATMMQAAEQRRVETVAVNEVGGTVTVDAEVTSPMASESGVALADNDGTSEAGPVALGREQNDQPLGAETAGSVGGSESQPDAGEASSSTSSLGEPPAETGPGGDATTSDGGAGGDPVSPEPTGSSNGGPGPGSSGSGGGGSDLGSTETGSSSSSGSGSSGSGSGSSGSGSGGSAPSVPSSGGSAPGTASGGLLDGILDVVSEPIETPLP